MPKLTPLTWWSALLGVAVLIALAAMPWSRSTPQPAESVPNHAFRSVPGPTATVWAVGDGADGGRSAGALARRIGAQDPDRVLYLGDVYPEGRAEDFRDNFAGVYGPLADRMAPTPGNHDWPARAEGYEPYWRSVTRATTPPWYEFRAGGWRIYSLNSEAPHGATSPQIAWLKQRLRKQHGDCSLAFWHRPRFSAGSHGDQSDMEPLWRVLQGRARIVVAGHDHNMQRFRPSRGIVELIAGTGGAGSYELDSRDPRLAFADDTQPGALRLDLAPGRADVAFVGASGRPLDATRVPCDGSGAGR